MHDELKKFVKVDIPVKVKRSEAQNECRVIFINWESTQIPQNLLRKAGVLRGEEEYLLEVNKKYVAILGKSSRGLFYGLQTLLQIMIKEGNKTIVPCLRIHDFPALAIRGAHFDFRMQCLRPRFDYLKKAIKTLARYKINTILWEYEDKFPYKKHPLITSPVAFCREEVNELLTLARQYHIQVIPLLQSLGHVDYILQYEEYAHLREDKNNISQYCPLNPESFKLFKELCSELLPFHTDTPYFHVGADETRLLGRCPKCKERASTEGKFALYQNYMEQVFDFLHKNSKTPIIWGDMLLTHKEKIESFPKKVEIMDWEYETTEVEKLTSVDFLREHGFKVWSAPSTRSGLSGNIFPYYRVHIPNIAAYIDKAVESSAAGVVTTSWASSNVPFEATWYGLLYTAEHSWAGDGIHRTQFDNKFCREFYGLKSTEIVEATYLLGHPIKKLYELAINEMSDDFGPEIQIIDPQQVKADAERAHDILTKLKAKKNDLNRKYLVLSASMELYEAEQLLLFEEVERLLLRTQEGKAKAAELDEMISRICRLKDRLSTLKRDVVAAYRETNVDFEVGRDILNRYLKGERNINKYIRELGRIENDEK